MSWFILVLKKYADFKGRARRKEYWMFILFASIFSIMPFGLDVIFDTLVFGFLYQLVLVVPSLAVSVRRLHDTGNSGWMLLISLIPIIGGIWFFVLTVTDGDRRANEYGENPKKVVA